MPAVNGVGEPCAGEPHARIEVAAGGIWCRVQHAETALAPPADPTWAWSVGLLSAGIPPGSGRRSGLVLRRARVGGLERHDRRDRERSGRLRLTGRAGW
jgi:hypothetical protein